MSLLRPCFRDVSRAAAAEMALVIPLLLAIMCGAFEIGKYFLDEHILVTKRFGRRAVAARQNFSNYSTAARAWRSVLTTPATWSKTGRVSGGTDRLPYWARTTSGDNDVHDHRRWPT